MRSIFAAATDVGRKRTQNEDSYRADPQLGLYLVADGMGGHAAGEVASQTAADAVHQFIVDTATDGERSWPFGLDPSLSFLANRLRAAILVANQSLFSRVQQDETLQGMATTISATLFGNEHIAVSNVGDCRVYRIRQAGIKQVTTDHSWVAEQVRAGLMSAAAARAHPWRSMVTRALAGTADLSVDVLEMELTAGDVFLLCSDGLHGLIGDDEMLHVVRSCGDDLQEACRRLIETANERGGPDNITSILISLA
jgi:PPM family protein phosphatase